MFASLKKSFLYWQTDRQTDREGQTDKQTQSESKTDRQALKG